MKKVAKNVIMILCMALLMFVWKLDVKADKGDIHIQKDKVMKITIIDGDTKIIRYLKYNLWCEDDEYYESFDYDDNIYMLKSGEDRQATLDVEVLDTDFIVPDSVQYNKNITIKDEDYIDFGVSFQYKHKYEGIATETLPQARGFALYASVDSMYVATTKQGFNPSKNNYIKINALLNHNIERCSDHPGISPIIETKIKVINSNNKYVYQKKYNFKWYESKEDRFINTTWDGKVSKGNSAGISYGQYAPSGEYYVEVIQILSAQGYEKAFSKRVPLTISKKAPKGIKGVKNLKNVPILTGDAEVDFLAEKMCKAAGVKTNMSADKKVKKIYTYMTKKFKHVHNVSTRKKYYNLKSLKSKITAYKAKTDKQVSQGKMIYSYEYFGDVENNMVRRGGVCDHHAMIFMILCNHVGVDAGISGGYYKNMNGSLAPHAWNYAIVGGKKYYYDVDIEIQNYGNGQGNYYWYKKTLSQAKKNHKFD